MNLTQDQKQYIKNNYKELEIRAISQKTGISEKDVKKYIIKKYGKIHENTNEKKQTTSSNLAVGFKSFFKTHQIHFLSLVLLVAAIYINAIGNAFVSDDLDAILRNPNIGDFNFVLANPRAIMLTLPYFFIFKLFGANPIFFRFFNIILHVSNISLVFFIIYKITGKDRLAFLTSLIFACHPVLIESVTWISGRPYTQYSFFLLLSFYFYISSETNIKKYILSILFFILAVLTSEKAIAFPLIIFLYDFSFGKLKENWKKTSGFFLLLSVGVLYFGSQIGERLQSVMRLSAGAAGQNLNLFFTLPVAISSYFELIFWPKDLTLYHSEMVFSQTAFIVRFTVLLIYIAATLFFFFKKNRLVFFFLAFFALALSPTLTPLGISWIVAERYAYFGSIGIFFCVAYLFDNLMNKKNYKEIFLYSFAFLIIALSVRTVIRNADWTSEDTLWFATGKTSPSSQSTHNNLGDVYARRKDYPNAILEFKKAVEINPNYSDAWHNLALTYQNAGQTEEAIKTYKHAISINPNLWQSYENLAQIYFSQNNLREVRKVLESLIEINPKKSAYYVNLGIVDIREGKTEDARKEFLKALEVDPEDEEARKRLEQLQK